MKPGTVVQLKSGGPSMTVGRVDEDRQSANCVWWVNTTHEYHSKEFMIALLKEVKKP